MKKQNKITTKLLSLALSCTLIFGLVGCKEDENAFDVNSVDFFTCYNTYKVKKDQMPSEKEKLSIDEWYLPMSQGEYEMTTLAMNSPVDVDYYNVSVKNDFTMVGDSSVKFSKDNFSIYKQEYMYVGSRPTLKDDEYSPGFFPDAMIPMHAIIAYEQNNFKANENQGITVQVSTRPLLDENDNPIVVDEYKNLTETELALIPDADKYYYNEAGVYEGYVTVEFGNPKDGDVISKDFKLTIEIFPATVSETSHVKIDLHGRTTMYNPELNYTQEARDAWSFGFIKYRNNLGRPWCEQQGSESSYRNMVETTTNVLRGVRSNNITIGLSTGTFGVNYFWDYALHGNPVKTENADKAYAIKYQKDPVSGDYILDGSGKKIPETTTADYFYLDKDGKTSTSLNSSRMKYDSTGTASHLNSVTCFSVSLAWQNFDRYVQKCIDDNYNYFNKLNFAVSVIDEPAVHNRFPETQAVGFLFDRMMEDYADVLETGELLVGAEYNWYRPKTFDWTGKEDLRQAIIKEFRMDMDPNGPVSLAKDPVTGENYRGYRGLKLIVTQDYLKDWDPYIDTWCPTRGHYASSAERSNYANQDERYWYGFNYGIDWTLLEPRMTWWQAAEYQVPGYLSWSCDSFYDTKRGGIMIDEFFKTNYYRSAENYGAGDAYFMYPGAQYELDEPIPSIRMQAMCDGIEEYELFYNIRNKYEEISNKIGVDFTAQDLISGLGANIYNGVTAKENTKLFYEARLALLNLAECTESSAEMCIASVKDDGYGNVTYKIYLKNTNGERTILTNNGQAVNVFEPAGSDGYMYTINVNKRDNLPNEINIAFNCDGRTYSYSQGSGDDVEIVNAETIGASSFVKGGGTVTPYASLKDTNSTDNGYSSLYDGDTKDILLDIYCAENNVSEVSFCVQSNAVKSLFNNAYSALTINVYNPNNFDISIESLAKGERPNSSMIKMFSVDLKANDYTQIVINLATTDWEKNPFKYMWWTVKGGYDYRKTPIVSANGDLTYPLAELNKEDFGFIIKDVVITKR